jgi:hypothetical protein
MLVVVTLAVGSFLSAEPLHSLLVKYAGAYREFEHDIRAVADSVRTRPEAQFDYRRLEAALEATGRLIVAAVPETDVATKSVSVRGGFLNEAHFRSALGDLDDLAQDLGDLAGQMWAPAGLAIPSQPGRPIRSYTDIESYGHWNLIQLDLKELELARTIEDFEIRYGSKSDRINLLELLLVNHVPPFRGSVRGPSAWEPILRVSPVCFSVSDNRFIKTAQLGFNYYFLSGAPRLLRALHHIGLAPTVADVNADRVYRIGTLGWGATVHLGRYQVGAVYVPDSARVNVFSTLDFQIIPTLF